MELDSYENFRRGEEENGIACSRLFREDGERMRSRHVGGVPRGEVLRGRRGGVPRTVVRDGPPFIPL